MPIELLACAGWVSLPAPAAGAHPPRRRSPPLAAAVQVVHCLAEVACPELARQHELCFIRVVNSRGAEPYSACDVHVQKMKKCLGRHGLYPFEKTNSAKG